MKYKFELSYIDPCDCYTENSYDYKWTTKRFETRKDAKLFKQAYLVCGEAHEITKIEEIKKTKVS